MIITSVKLKLDEILRGHTLFPYEMKENVILVLAARSRIQKFKY